MYYYNAISQRLIFRVKWLGVWVISAAASQRPPRTTDSSFDAITKSGSVKAACVWASLPPNQLTSFSKDRNNL